MLFRVADGELRLGDLQAEAFAPRESAAGGEDEFRVRRGVIFAQRRDEPREVLLVMRGVDGVLILVALPPHEARDFVALPFVVGINFCEVGERRFGIGHVVVVLLARIPRDALRLGALHPRIRRVLVAREDLGDFLPAALGDFRLESLTARRQQIPAEAAVADAAFQNEHRFIEELAHHKTEADFRSDGVPVVRGRAQRTALLHAGIVIEDILPHRPLSRIIEQKRILLFRLCERRERAGFIRRIDVAHADHVRLAHEDEDFHLLRLVGGFGVGPCESVRRVRIKFVRRQRAARGEDECCEEAA